MLTDAIIHCKKNVSGDRCISIYGWKRIQIYPEIKLPSIHGFGSKYSWKNFLGFLTDDAIMKSRKNCIVGIFSTQIKIQQKSGSNSGLFRKNIRRIGIRLWPEFPGKSENTRKNFQDLFYSVVVTCNYDFH